MKAMHTCQPANSPVSVPITTKAADKQPNQHESSKNQQSYKGKGVQNMHPFCLYLIKTFLFKGTF